jgi:hypothetical protein
VPFEHFEIRTLDHDVVLGRAGLRIILLKGRTVKNRHEHRFVLRLRILVQVRRVARPHPQPESPASRVGSPYCPGIRAWRIDNMYASSDPNVSSSSGPNAEAHPTPKRKLIGIRNMYAISRQA